MGIDVGIQASLSGERCDIRLERRGTMRVKSFGHSKVGCFEIPKSANLSMPRVSGLELNG
jgi:hypothetical protein